MFLMCFAPRGPAGSPRSAAARRVASSGAKAWAAAASEAHAGQRAHVRRPREGRVSLVFWALAGRPDLGDLIHVWNSDASPPRVV